MSESGFEGNKTRGAVNKEMVLAAMMEELGVSRKDTLYLNDKGPRVPKAIIETATARSINPSDPIASHWKTTEFDDVDEADRLLDPIAHGQLYRQRQAILKDQSKARFAGHAPNMQQYSGSGSRGNKSGRGGHGGASRAGYSHVGERSGNKGSLGKVSGVSGSGQTPRKSINEARGRADKSSHVDKCISRLRKKPSQTQQQPAQPQRSRARELPGPTFTLATPEEFFAHHAKQNSVQQAPNPSGVPANATQPHVAASTPSTKVDTSSNKVFKSPTNANSSSKDVNSPTNPLPKVGLAASMWAPSNSVTATANNTSSSKTLVKDPNNPTITLPKQGLAASRWAPPNHAADVSSNISGLKSAVEHKIQPNVKADIGPTLASPKDGLAASKWAPSKQAMPPAHKIPRLESPMKGHIQLKGKGAENDVFTAKSTVGLQGSNWETSKKLSATSSKPPVKPHGSGEVEAVKPEISPPVESSTVILAADTHTHNQVVNDSLRPNSAQKENAVYMPAAPAPAPALPVSVAHPTSTVSELIPISHQPPDTSRGGSTVARPPFFANRISCATLSDLSVLEGSKKLISFGDSDEDEEQQEPEQPEQVHVMLSALFDLAEMNDQYVIEGIFNKIDEYYGSFLTHLCNDVGHQNLGVDAPTDELLASENHLKASKRLVENFFKSSETFKQLAKLEEDTYIKDLSCKMFAKALTLRDSINTTNQVSERASFENPIPSAGRTQSNVVRNETSLPARIVPDSNAATLGLTTRYKYTISDLLQLGGQALVIKGELLSKREIGGLRPQTSQNVVRYTTSGLAIVAGREDDREVTHPAPKFKPSSSASDWRAFANFKSTTSPAVTPCSETKLGNSVTTLESDSHKNLEGGTAQSTILPPKEGSNTGGTRHAPRNSTDEKLAKVFEGLNINADRGPISPRAITTPNKDSRNISARASAGAASMRSSLGSTGPQSPQETSKQQKGPNVSSAQSPRPLNAMAAEYKSPSTRPTFPGLQNKRLDSKSTPGLAASIWSSTNSNTNLTPAQQTPLKQTGTWRILDPQSGNMMDIVGEIVNVFHPIKVVAPPMLSMTTKPFSNQENIPILSGETSETVGAKAKATIADAPNEAQS